MFRYLSTRTNLPLQILKKNITPNVGIFCTNQRYFSQGKNKIICIPPTVSPRSLAKLTNKRIVDILKEMIKMDHHPTSPDESIPPELAEMIVLGYGFGIERALEVAEKDIFPDPTKVGDKSFEKRQPIVAIMGHVDHGKTTLLDTLRDTSVVSEEFGGITQHIGAFEVDYNGDKLTFIDTPGHAAFSKMRERGTKVADIVIIVIAADAGVQEQTDEVLQFVQEFDVPYIIAINKIDKDNANVKQIQTQLLKRDISVEQIGGEVPCVEISAKNSIGIDTLIETIFMVCEFNDSNLYINTNTSAEAHVIDVYKDKGKGVAASLLIYAGTLNPGDFFVCGLTYGKVKNIFDTTGMLEIGIPSKPINITGFKGKNLPVPGDQLLVVETEEQAMEAVEIREFRSKSTGQEDIIKEKEQERMQFRQDLIENASKGFAVYKEWMKEKKQSYHMCEEIDTKNTVYVVLKADVPGSIEGLESSLSEIPCEKFGIKVEIISRGIGTLSETDIDYAKLTKGYLVAFNIPINVAIQTYARAAQVEIHKANIIYSVVDEVVKEIESRLPPTKSEMVIGRAEVKQVFTLNSHRKRLRKSIAGCTVDLGTIFRSSKYVAKVSRDGKALFTGPIESLKHFSEDVNEVKKGKECGIRVEDWEDYQEGDTIEVIEYKYHPASLNWVYTKSSIHTQANEYHEEDEVD